MQIFIKMMTGKSFVLDVEPFDTIKKVKLMIQQKEGIPHRQQNLFNKLRAFSPLEDGRTLNEYFVHVGSTLELQLSLRPSSFFMLYIMKLEIN